MRPLALLALVSVTALAQGRFDRFNARTNQGRSDRGFDSSGAFFEAFPASGAGTSGVCSTTAPTGAKGETLTFSRSSVAECYSNDGQTLTQLAANQPRVSSGRADSSLLGLWKEEARQNDTLRNRDWSQAAWTKSNVTCTKTVTGMRNDANGASTCSASANAGTVVQTLVTAAATRTGSFHVKRRTGTGTIEVTRDNAVWIDITDRLSSSLWRRVVSRERPGCMGGNCIVVPQMDSTAANPSIGIRFGTSGDAVDVDFAQDEAGAEATSPIETAGSAVPRAAESASFSPPPMAIGALGGRFVGVTAVSGRAAIFAYVSGNRFTRSFFGTTTAVGSGLNCEYWENPANPANANTFLAPGLGSIYAGCRLASATSLVNCLQGACNTDTVASYTPTSASYVLYVGQTNAGAFQANGVVAQLCADPVSCSGNPTPSENASIAWLGDSIIAGTNTYPNHPPRVLRDSYTGKAVFDFATGGYTAAQCAARWTAALSGSGHKTLIWSCAVNSLAAGITGAATWATAQAVVAEARAQGLKVIITQVTPWKNSGGWTAGKQTETAAYNAAASAWATVNGAQFISTASLGGQGGDPDLLLATYDSGDLIHPNVAGAALFTSLVAAANP